MFHLCLWYVFVHKLVVMLVKLGEKKIYKCTLSLIHYFQGNKHLFLQNLELLKMFTLYFFFLLDLKSKPEGAAPMIYGRKEFNIR